MRMDRFYPILSESDLTFITVFSVYHNTCMTRAKIVKKVFKSVQLLPGASVASEWKLRKKTHKITLPGIFVYLSNVKVLKDLFISTFVDTYAVYGWSYLQSSRARDNGCSIP